MARDWAHRAGVSPALWHGITVLLGVVLAAAVTYLLNKVGI